MPKSSSPVSLVAEACSSSTVAMSVRSAISVVVLAAVDVQRLPADAAGQVTGHEHDRRSHLVLGRQTLEVRVGSGGLVDLVGGGAVLASLVLEVALQRLTPDVSGRNGVHSDTLLAEFGGQRLRHRQQCGFGHL